eukprot:2331691-Pyramimonas_sp.AAC.1
MRLPWGHLGPSSRHLGSSWCPCFPARAALEARDADPPFLTRDHGLEGHGALGSSAWECGTCTILERVPMG